MWDETMMRERQEELSAGQMQHVQRIRGTFVPPASSLDMTRRLQCILTLPRPKSLLLHNACAQQPELKLSIGTHSEPARQLWSAQH